MTFFAFTIGPTVNANNYKCQNFRVLTPPKPGIPLLWATYQPRRNCFIIVYQVCKGFYSVNIKKTNMVHRWDWSTLKCFKKTFSYPLRYFTMLEGVFWGFSTFWGFCPHYSAMCPNRWGNRSAERR